MPEARLDTPLSGNAAPPRPTWPRVLGTIGVILAAIIVVDQLDDLRVVGWTVEEWSSVLGPELGALVAASMPPALATLLSVAVTVALALMLGSGGLQLRRYHKRGAQRLVTWAWLAIVWTVASTGGGLWWFSRTTTGINTLAPGGWTEAAVLGVLVALGLMLAFPVFVLLWMNRSDVQAEVARWAY
jgi:hypothetical protein